MPASCGTALALYTAEAEPVKRTRAEMYRSVDADYYGYRDDEDGVLAPLEAAAEAKSACHPPSPRAGCW
jgi:hypothetical protein